MNFLLLLEMLSPGLELRSQMKGWKCIAHYEMPRNMCTNAYLAYTSNKEWKNNEQDLQGGLLLNCFMLSALPCSLTLLPFCYPYISLHFQYLFIFLSNRHILELKVGFTEQQNLSS